MSNTEFGFNFGAMKVTRVYGDNKSHLINIKTPKVSISVRSTPTGQVRFFDEQGNECELVNKQYANNLHEGKRVYGEER